MNTSRVVATLVIVVAAGVVGAVGRSVVDRDAAAPAPCARPVLRDGVVVCDGVGADLGPGAWLFGDKLDVNTANEANLARIKGIGPALAGRIVAHRQAIGAFGSVDDLDDVDGVGPKLLEKLKAAVEVRPTP